MNMTFTYSLGPTEASAAGPILTSGLLHSVGHDALAFPYQRGIPLIF